MAYRLRFYIGAYLAILGGLDALVFTATVGVRSAPTRARVLIGLEHLGIKLDSARNEEGSAQLQTDDAGIEILLQPSDENLAIARATQTLLAAGSS
jgi:acetate kinase